MKVEVEDISAVKKSMSVEVGPDEVAKEVDAVVRGYARQAKLPGFRPGKAPLSLIRKKFGDEIRSEVRDRVMSRTFRAAAAERGLRPLGDPVVDEVDETAAEDGPFRFKTTFEVLPKIELADYRGIEVRRPPADVPDADVDKALEDLRGSRATLEAVEGRKARTGDWLVADMHGAPEGAEPFDRERMTLELGSTDNLPEFNDRLEGAAPGDELEFDVAYPEEYGAEELAGKTVRFRVKVHEVKQRRLPELDDEFAKDLGDFDDLAALRARIREDLERRKKAEAEGRVRQSLLDKLLLDNPVALPESLVDDEVRFRLEEIVRRMMMQGMDPQKTELDWKQLREQQEEGSRKAVHARLLLDAVAEREKLAVDDAEVEARIRHDAARMGETYENVRATLERQGGAQVIRNQLVREKALDLLTAVANIHGEE